MVIATNGIGDVRRQNRSVSSEQDHSKSNALASNLMVDATQNEKCTQLLVAVVWGWANRSEQSLRMVAAVDLTRARRHTRHLRNLASWDATNHELCAKCTSCSQHRPINNPLEAYAPLRIIHDRVTVCRWQYLCIFLGRFGVTRMRNTRPARLMAHFVGYLPKLLFYDAAAFHSLTKWFSLSQPGTTSAPHMIRSHSFAQFNSVNRMIFFIKVSIFKGLIVRVSSWPLDLKEEIVLFCSHSKANRRMANVVWCISNVFPYSRSRNNNCYHDDCFVFCFVSGRVPLKFMNLVNHEGILAQTV